MRLLLYFLSWKEFKQTLKHKKKDISLDDLANHLRVEEKCCMQEKRKKSSMLRNFQRCSRQRLDKQHWHELITTFTMVYPDTLDWNTGVS